MAIERLWNIWKSDLSNKTRIIPSCKLISITMQLYKLDSKHLKKKLLFEQILEAVFFKTGAIRPLTSNLANHPSKMSKTRWALLEK